MADNKLYYGDNLEVLRKHIADESVDLVYLDPPFNSNRNYNVIFGKHARSENGSAQIQAFGDTWTWTPTTDQQYEEAIGGGVPGKVVDALIAMRGLLTENDAMAYLVNMAPRLVELHRVLKPAGSLYLHCDPTMSHYLKIILDAVFGLTSFQNEVIWHYRGGGVSKSRWGRRHDVLLFYAKGQTPRTFNVDAVREEYSPETLERLRYKARAFRGDKVYDTYEANPLGKHPDDVWDIQPIMPSAKERLGYPTQKPERLLERVILASSDEGDLVLDPFCGCGTTIATAHRLNRRWLGIDVTYIAIDLIEKRLRHTFGPSITDTFEVLGIPRDLGAAHALFDRSHFDFERWAVSLINAQPNEKQVGDKGVDGVARFPLDGKGKAVGRVLASVKGGKTVTPQFVRDLIGTVETQKAEMGVLITMAQPSRGVLDAVAHGGTYTWPVNGETFPRIQVITIEELLKGQRPKLPSLFLPYIQASKLVAPSQQEALDLE